MIKLLHIENIAVIEKADIEFAEGLNVLTGETGAGKSIVIDALSAVTGGKVWRGIVRTGAPNAIVTAVFSGVDGLPWFNENGVETDEGGEVIITRKISSDGKSTCRVNGMPVTAMQLRELGAELLDIHGQNDGKKLLDEGAHLRYLDVFGELAALLQKYSAAYERLGEMKKEISKISFDESEKARRIDVLEYQIAEIERVNPAVGEHEELMSKRELLMNASKLTEAIEAAVEALFGGDNSSGAAELISEAQEQVAFAARYAQSLESMADRLRDLRYLAQDVSDELRDFRGRLDFSPEEFDDLEIRLNDVRHIVRKYGSVEKALLDLGGWKDELLSIEDSAYRLEKLGRELERAVDEAREISEELSRQRKARADELSRRIMEELAQLNMPGTRFVAEFNSIGGEYGLCATGRDEVRFLMSANAGEDLGRISRIASGGELSRIMLALKNVISGDTETGAMVFDEIDAGVSGIAAQRVGEKLSDLARSRQVLCVTHLPQIAVMADAHFEITKTADDGRIFTHVRELSFDGRKQEIARLVGGENVTDTTLSGAAEQLTAAQQYKNNHKILSERTVM